MSGGQLPIVFADESNNTGENLQDVNQPVFTVAGVHLGDARADGLVAEVAGRLQDGAGEPKYSLLRRRARSRDALVETLKSLPPDSVKVFIADKKFMVVSKIVDLGIEPAAYDTGWNMLADDSARKLAHLLVATGGVLGDAAAFDTVLDTFNAVVLERPGVKATDYVKAAKAYLTTVDAESLPLFRNALLPHNSWLHELMFERARGAHPDVLDPAIPAVVEVCRGFHGVLGSFKLVHDHSKVIDRAKNLLLMVDQMPDLVDEGKLQASIGVKEVEFGDSQAFSQLKIADWVAGFTKDVCVSRWANPPIPVDDDMVDLVEGWMASPPLALDLGLLA
jgi:hypothetical protein